LNIFVYIVSFAEEAKAVSCSAFFNIFFSLVYTIKDKI